MKEFDYDLYRVVGFVEDKFGDHGFISVVGYCDDNLDVFHEINASEAKSLFPPKGEIFAHNFSKNHNERKGTLICICVRPNTNPGIDKDEFIWDKDEEVIDYGNQISNMKMDNTTITFSNPMDVLMTPLKNFFIAKIKYITLTLLLTLEHYLTGTNRPYQLFRFVANSLLLVIHVQITME